jgi:hypothetical protein
MEGQIYTDSERKKAVKSTRPPGKCGFPNSNVHNSVDKRTTGISLIINYDNLHIKQSHI